MPKIESAVATHIVAARGAPKPNSSAALLSESAKPVDTNTIGIPENPHQQTRHTSVTDERAGRRSIAPAATDKDKEKPVTITHSERPLLAIMVGGNVH
jgi:hypothetical protein